MNRWHVLFVGTVLAAGGLLFWERVGKPAHPQLAAGPLLELPGQEVTDLGEGKLQETLQGSFTLRNKGGAPLRFQLDPGCGGCTTVTPRQGTLPPGAEEKITVKVTLRTLGKKELVAVKVQSNDAQCPVAERYFAAHCPAPYQVEPATLHFGRVLEGTVHRQVFKVRGGHGEQLSPASPPAMEATSPRIQLHPVTEEGLAYEVRLENLPRGDFAGFILLKVPGSDEKMQVPVTAQVVAKVITVPSSILLPDTNSSAGKRSAFLVKSLDNQPLGKLVKVDMPKWLELTPQGDDTTASTVRRYSLACKAAPPDDKAVDIHLYFEGLPEPVILRVLALQS